MRIVPDASAVVEVLMRTAVGMTAEEIFFGSELFAPELLDVEVAAVMKKALASGRLSQGRASDALAILRDLHVFRLSHRDLVLPAFALRENYSIYDAVYVVAARVMDATLLTADGPLSRAPRIGVPVHNIRC
ncbi:MAG: type II toxin-antitoxin system VapC family toxin [Acidobacteria bacterium]|nr:type II toxin-antitoxin system VapC family toxin [Acidobacteriota bacterium]